MEERTGITSHALALPSCGETSADEAPGGLIADAAALRGALDQVDDAIVVGHSYGGTVIAEAGHHPAVAHLLYVSSYLPDVGQAQGAIMSGEPDPVAVAMVGDGAVASFGTPTTAAGWQGVDSTYLVCGEDRSTSLELQRFHAARAQRSVTLPAGHHPFISRPDLVLAELEALLG